MSDATPVPEVADPWFIRSPARLYAALFAFLALPMCALCALVYIYERNELYTETLTRDRIRSELVAQTFRAQYGGIAAYVESYANRPPLVRALEARNGERIGRLLADLMRDIDLLDRAFVTDAEGTLLFDHPNDPAVSGKNFSHRDWFRGASARPGPYASEVYQRDALDKPLVVAFACGLVNDAGITTGYLVAQVRVEALASWLSEISPAEIGMILLIDQQGRLLSCDKGCTTPLSLAEHPLTVRARSEGAGWLECSNPVTGDASLASFMHVPSFGWTVAAFSPLAHVYAPLNRLLALTAACLGISLAAMMAVGAALLRRIQRHDRLRRAAEDALRRSHEVLEHRVAERTRALSESEERFRIVARATNDAVWDWNLQTGAIWWGEGAQTLFGHTPGAAAKDAPGWADHIHPDDRDRVLETMRNALANGSEHWNEEYRFQRADGTYADTLDRAYIIRNERGDAVRIIGAMMDVTERNELERRFLHSQKMEGIGRLAGGIAHDFNNILTVIQGGLDFALEELPPDSPVRADIQQTLAAAGRAAALTSQLLAFARKQIMQPRVLNLNDLVGGMDHMLRRLIGEDILLEISPAPDLGLVKADAAMLEQVLVNIVVNARDAMPAGGRICIETANVFLDEDYAGLRAEVTPGPYVMFAVTDTGTGIEPDVLDHIFEPFFTTKEQGRGTGLGLPTCYGIVKQAGGHISVYSEPGQGASFKIYLPRVNASNSAAESREAPVMPAAGTETVLIVEDEPLVRDMAARALRARGYEVLTAKDGAEGLQTAAGYNGVIDLVITDVVMPRMGGKEMAARMRAEKPALKILFISGYAENAIVHHGVLDPGIQFLAKPFSVAALLGKVREVLDHSP